MRRLVQLETELEEVAADKEEPNRFRVDLADLERNAAAVAAAVAEGDRYWN